MKSNLHFILFFLIPILSFSQTPISKKVYLDSLWNETDEINHKYYRIVKDYSLEQDQYIFQDYYKSGKIQMKGASKAKDYLSKEGQFIYYYENGNKRSIANYVNSRPSGKQYDWHENGQIKSEIEYLESQNGPISEISVNQFWNTENVQKVIDGNGDYEYSDDKQHESGKIKNGFHDGIWKGQSKNLNCSYTEIYENGKFISGISIDSRNVEHPYKIILSKAEPKKGIDHFYSYIANNIRKTKEAQINNISGKIYLTFIVKGDGNIDDIKIIKGLGYGLDDEAIMVLKSYRGWTPGKMKGIPVRFLYSLPITIR
ncbi:energy transducer TonB [Flavobacterium ranwuense]|uniref:Energy transducer TonB n=1 Tax=Flavobacterium ranwuense TaxID=2541725 RepID=A0ABY2DS12_9FLAO|nr:energy transducer TonB [Flavobacterium ranwuense]TDE29740.1 energy transducer TonB [Flavobacterium ranwuense]